MMMNVNEIPMKNVKELLKRWKYEMAEEEASCTTHWTNEQFEDIGTMIEELEEAIQNDSVEEVFGDLVGTCECCEEKLGVWTENPYDMDVRNEHNMQFLCKECHHELMMDV